MIYDIISNVLIALGILYCAVVGAIFLGLFRNRKGRNNALSMVSVIVAARNEEENIEDCLSALALQDYPDDMYEVVVVNDRSSDGTEQIARSFEDRYYNFSLLNVTGEPLYACPKKNALNLGIESSRGEIILLTDADCRPPCSWISDMVGHFEPEVGLVAGVSPLDKGKNPHSEDGRIRIPLYRRLVRREHRRRSPHLLRGEKLGIQKRSVHRGGRIR